MVVPKLKIRTECDNFMLSHSKIGKVSTAYNVGIGMKSNILGLMLHLSLDLG